ncbi:hypothetical protein Pan258_47090 [Symmachiella dynata]|uniref:Uncharacterized protein n=1 Tax=Symmachiella dynata TaxID=2527995 RepID=A0A517ZV17_9PLAN|nr:hypothetical protein Pan258_47090 [Symmachiella dynata]QDU46285.1 hypothetical protein Mal52_48030 [Symmachiella dynata]
MAIRIDITQLKDWECYICRVIHTGPDQTLPASKALTFLTV